MNFIPFLDKNKKIICTAVQMLLLEMINSYQAIVKAIRAGR
jgi:hypothetical protein